MLAATVGTVNPVAHAVAVEPSRCDVALERYTRERSSRRSALAHPGWIRALRGSIADPALNEMIDFTGTREMATLNHPPLIVFLLLGWLSVIGAMLVGVRHVTRQGP